MKPTNDKSLVNFLYDQMEKLDQRTVMENLDQTKAAAESASAQAKLASQINGAMLRQIKRAEVEMKLAEHNAKFRDGLKVKEIEDFDFSKQPKTYYEKKIK